MGRIIKTTVIAAAARDYARMFLGPDRSRDGRPVDGPAFVMANLYNMAYRDEHEALVAGIRDELGAVARDRFDKMAKKVFTKRTDAAFEEELAARLGITMDGDHREGSIGRVQVGRRLMGMRAVEVEADWSLARRRAEGLGKEHRKTVLKMLPYYWPIYAGEAEERSRPGGGVADDFPEDYFGVGVGAEVTRIGNGDAIAAANAIVDRLDGGTGAAVVKIYGDTIPTDVDTAIGVQTLLATHVCSDPAFAGAADANPGGRATASAIADDTSIDATDTATFFRASSTNDGATPIDDHIDGNAGVVDEALVLNTASFVAGATSSITAWTFTVPES